MSDIVVSVSLPEHVLRELERMAKGRGLSAADFVGRMTADWVARQAEAEAFFSERAKAADLDAFDRILNREGGAPPCPGDERD
jgi:hypothetical protein